MRNTHILLMTAFVLLFTACTTAKPTLPRDIGFNEVLQGLYAGPALRGLYLIRDKADFKKLRMSEIPQEFKKVDLSKNILLVAASGEKPHGGYEIKIVQVRELSDQVEVFFMEKQPSEDSFYTMAITTPFHAVSIPRTGKKIVFNQRAN